MKFECTIKNELGIHARPAGALVEESKKFKSKITVSFNGKTVNASSIMKLMMLQVKQNDTVTVEVDGSDEKEAVEFLEKFMKENF